MRRLGFLCISTHVCAAPAVRVASTPALSTKRHSRAHYSPPSLPRFAAALGSETRVLSDGRTVAPEQVPEEFARTVPAWVEHRPGGDGA
ncbi:hypothetical protein SGRIM119S_08680 [Streptomyces griseorubiginosus]